VLRGLLNTTFLGPINNLRTHIMNGHPQQWKRLTALLAVDGDVDGLAKELVQEAAAANVARNKTQPPITSHTQDATLWRRNFLISLTAWASQKSLSFNAFASEFFEEAMRQAKIPAAAIPNRKDMAEMSDILYTLARVGCVTASAYFSVSSHNYSLPSASLSRDLSRH